jgi:PAS domain S-box-containing protein
MSSPLVLIVEDEGILALHLRNSLLSLGYRVAAVVDTRAQALKEAERTRPDLVLMDIRIRGEMDGINTAEQIYERFDIPVVYLTAYADENTLERAKLTAPYGYLIKPFDEKELRPTIEIALNRHNLETKLRKSERWFSTTMKSMGDAVVVTDIRGQIIYMNPTAEGLTKWSSTQATGQDLERILRLLHEKKRQPLGNIALTVIKKGLVVTVEHKILVDREGQERFVDNSAAPIRDETGHIAGAVLIFRENALGGVTTGKKRGKKDGVEVFHEPQQLATQAAQLASLGVMAAGISHEINQPLHAILVSANSVLFWHKRNQGVLPETFIKKINDIADYAGRIDQIVRHLHSFWLAPDQDESEVVDLNEAVRNALTHFDRKIQTRGIRFIHEFDREPLAIRGSSIRLEQVIINLITNAITSLDRAQQTDKWMRLITRRRKGQACLEIQDNGPPVDEAILDKVFNPYFTEQKTDEGYGLKLAISKMFVEELKGQIEVAGGSPDGTTYTVRFPLMERKPEKLDENPAD